MKKRGKRCQSILLGALVLLNSIGTLGAGAASLRDAWNADLVGLELSAGALNKKFQATETVYEMTLGPNEKGFTLKAAPSETATPPTMRLTVDGASEEQLTVGQESKFIEVAPGQKRTVTITSAPHNDSTKPAKTYSVQVYRTDTAFTWTPVVVEHEGQQYLDVTLSASAGAKLQTLMFALGFDPAKLQVVGADELDYIRVEDNDFFYSSANPARFFDIVSQTVKNDTGVLAVQFGKALDSTSTYYTVPGESGTSSKLFTISFRLLNNASITSDTLKVLTEKDSRSVNPSTGISAMEYGSSAAKWASACPGMVSMAGATVAGTGTAEIYNMTVKSPAERQLTWKDGNGNDRFLFDPEQKSYKVYLLPEENSFELELHTFDEVKNVSLNGEALVAKPVGTVPQSFRWVRSGTENLTISMADLQMGKVLLALDRGDLWKTEYTIEVVKVTAAERPEIVLRQSTEDSSHYAAEIRNAQFTTASLELMVKGVTQEDVAALTAPSGLVVSKAVLTDVPGDDYDKLELTVDTASAAPCKENTVLELFAGTVDTDAKVAGDAGNSIGDVRFGGLYGVAATGSSAGGPSISFNLAGGELPLKDDGSGDPVDFVYIHDGLTAGQKLDIPSVEPLREGYSFAGWTDGANLYKYDKDANPAVSVTATDGPLTLAAKWVATTDGFCSVVFYDWDGTLLGSRIVPKGGSLLGDHETPNQRGDGVDQAPLPPEYELLWDVNGDNKYDFIGNNNVENDAANKMGYDFAGWVDNKTGFSTPNVANNAEAGQIQNPEDLIKLTNITSNLVVKAAYNENKKIAASVNQRRYLVSYTPFELDSGALQTEITVRRPENARRALEGTTFLKIALQPKGRGQVTVLIPLGASDVETVTFTMPLGSGEYYDATRALSISVVDDANAAISNALNLGAATIEP